MTQPAHDDPFGEPLPRRLPLPTWYMQTFAPPRHSAVSLPRPRASSVMPQPHPFPANDVRVTPVMGGAIQLTAFNEDGESVLEMRIRDDYFDERMVERLQRWAKLRPRRLELLK